MAAKMSATEFKKLVARMGWRTPEEIAAGLGISVRSAYNYQRRGCPLKSASNRMRRQMAIERRTA